MSTESINGNHIGLQEIDFSKNPYRGIWTELGRELNVSHTAVRKGYYNRNRKYVRLVNERVKAIKIEMGIES